MQEKTIQCDCDKEDAEQCRWHPYPPMQYEVGDDSCTCWCHSEDCDTVRTIIRFLQEIGVEPHILTIQTTINMLDLDCEATEQEILGILTKYEESHHGPSEEEEAFYKRDQTYQDGEEIYPNEEEQIKLRSLHWQEQALTQNNAPFDHSPHNAGYEEPEQGYEEYYEPDHLEGTFPTLAECEQVIREEINEHPL